MDNEVENPVEGDFVGYKRMSVVTSTAVAEHKDKEYHVAAGPGKKVDRVVDYMVWEENAMVDQLDMFVVAEDDS